MWKGRSVQSSPNVFLPSLHRVILHYNINEKNHAEILAENANTINRPAEEENVFLVEGR